MQDGCRGSGLSAFEARVQRMPLDPCWECFARRQLQPPFSAECQASSAFFSCSGQSDRAGAGLNLQTPTFFISYFPLFHPHVFYPFAALASADQSGRSNCDRAGGRHCTGFFLSSRHAAGCLAGHPVHCRPQGGGAGAGVHSGDCGHQQPPPGRDHAPARRAGAVPGGHAVRGHGGSGSRPRWCCRPRPTPATRRRAFRTC